MKKMLVLAVGCAVLSGNAQARMVTKDNARNLKDVARLVSHAGALDRALLGGDIVSDQYKKLADNVYTVLCSALEEGGGMDMKVNKIINEMAKAHGGHLLTGWTKEMDKTEEKEVDVKKNGKVVKDKDGKVEKEKVQVVVTDKDGKVEKVTKVNTKALNDAIWAGVRQGLKEVGYDVADKFNKSEKELMRRALRAATYTAVDGLVAGVATVGENLSYGRKNKDDKEFKVGTDVEKAGIIDAVTTQVFVSAAENIFYETLGFFIKQEMERDVAAELKN